MATIVQVHGLTEPPEGCEWHVGYPDKGTGEAHKTLSIVARRKWEPKPGEFVDCGFGRRCTFAYDFSSPERTNENKPILLVDEHGSRIFVHPDQIIGPWEPEASEKQEPLAVGDRVKVLPKGDDPLGLWKGTEYRNCGKFGVVSHAYATREFSVRFDGPDNTWAYSRCQLEKLPAETEPEPVWTTPDWAKEMGWMCEDEANGTVEFFATRPELGWDEWTGNDYIGSMSIDLAKSLNLYPPHWDSLPASERIINLSGDVK